MNEPPIIKVAQEILDSEKSYCEKLHEKIACEALSSNEEVCERCWPRMKTLIDRRKTQADEIERLRAALKKARPLLWSALHGAEQEAILKIVDKALRPADETLPRTGAYAPSATCKHGVHPYDCRQGCNPHETTAIRERVSNEIIRDPVSRNSQTRAESLEGETCRHGHMQIEGSPGWKMSRCVDCAYTKIELL